MEIELRLFANLRKKLPPEVRGKARVPLKEGAIIADLLREMDIPERLAQMVLVNGTQEKEVTLTLNDGDVVSIFPPVAGG
jgi:molybdopterin converting factor small subunit